MTSKLTISMRFRHRRESAIYFSCHLRHDFDFFGGSRSSATVRPRQPLIYFKRRNVDFANLAPMRCHFWYRVHRLAAYFHFDEMRHKYYYLARNIHDAFITK